MRSLPATEAAPPRRRALPPGAALAPDLRLRARRKEGSAPAPERPTTPPALAAGHRYCPASVTHDKHGAQTRLCLPTASPAPHGRVPATGSEHFARSGPYIGRAGRPSPAPGPAQAAPHSRDSRPRRGPSSHDTPGPFRSAPPPGEDPAAAEGLARQERARRAPRRPQRSGLGRHPPTGAGRADCVSQGAQRPARRSAILRQRLGGLCWPAGGGVSGAAPAVPEGGLKEHGRALEVRDHGWGRTEAASCRGPHRFCLGFLCRAVRGCRTKPPGLVWPVSRIQRLSTSNQPPTEIAPRKYQHAGSILFSEVTGCHESCRNFEFVNAASWIKRKCKFIFLGREYNQPLSSADIAGV